MQRHRAHQALETGQADEGHETANRHAQYIALRHQEDSAAEKTLRIRMDVVPILSRQLTMTRWYYCYDCGHQFQETTATSMPSERVKCQGEGCGKTGFCVTRVKK